MSKKSFEDQVDELISKKFRLVHDPCFTPDNMREDMFKFFGVKLTDDQAKALSDEGNKGSFKLEVIS